MNGGIIYYFSGTGNTEFAAKKFRETLKTKGFDIELKAIDLLKEKPDLKDYNLIGLGFPIYAYNLPINIRRFINDLPTVQNKSVFIFVTMGDLTSLGALGITADLLKKKGFAVISAEGFQMLSNDIILFNAADSKSARFQLLREAAIRKIKKIVDEIQSGKGKIHGNSVFMKFLSGITGFWLNHLYRPWFHYHKFYVDEKCLPECRLCEQFCPVNNIKKIDTQKVIFNRACILCARCINCCPVYAIQYGKSQKKRRFKDPDYEPPILR
jgi:flavodoxin/Pyruvate/2-oxoacid:ferredoxin oxidoreductase delta subunit